MNKATAQNTYRKSIAETGIEAARLALGAQRMFNNCRPFNGRSESSSLAHARACIVAGLIIKNSSDQKERSEAGRIISESRYIGW